MKLELFVDIYNVYNHQGTANVDNTTRRTTSCRRPACAGAQQNANPISGGTYEDLIWVKTIDANGNETGTPIGRNPNFHNTIAPLRAGVSARLGVRLTF